MKIQSVSFCIGLLALAIAPAIHAQTYSKKAELELGATGDTFKIGDTVFRIAPQAVVKASTPQADPARDLVVADYVVEPVAAQAPSPRSKRSIDSAVSSPGGAVQNLAAAVSDGGLPVVVAPELNVYFDQIGVLDALVRDTGGTLVYSSQVGGKGTIAYGSVAEAMTAMRRIQARAGVKEVSPRLIQSRRVAK
ncbi:hypothetical protein [Lysobacter sp. CA199]|uniref:hypothetical protein n=1 Tax=Lysobacter sp. CA199 TaxID=3455608 RepID=UPI003F8D1776